MIYYNLIINLSKELFNKLDTSIRIKLQRNGISIIQNIYTGFDTEFKNIDVKTNKLLSVQFMLNTKLILKIPKLTDFCLSTVGTLNNQIYKLSKSLRKSLPSDILENSFNNLINDCRVLKFGDYDINIKLLITKLKDLKLLSYFEDDNYINFAFPRTPSIPYIKLVDNYTFENLIHKSNELAEPYLIKSYNLLMELLLKETKQTNLIEGDLSDIVNVDENNLIELTIDNKDSKENSKEGLFKTIVNLTKSLTRTFIKISTTPKVSVTKIKNNYMIAHLTAADLSMFSDFDKFKNQLDIVNKCFITLGKPMNYANSRVIIRDTFLLAPAEKRSLASIGSIYKIDKIELPKELKDKMDILLEQDKRLFIDYALRDAEITLIHANSMEDFNFGLNNIGIPVTIPSLTKKFILND
jgi:hypothetical protein